MSLSFEKIYNAWNQGPLRMAGTEGTYQYAVVAATRRGRVGVRDVGSYYRIRVEPVPRAFATTAIMVTKMAGVLPRDNNWKQPGDGGQDRFSTMVWKDTDEVAERLEDALRAIGLAEGLKALVNAGAPKWAKEIASKMASEKNVREVGVGLTSTDPSEEGEDESSAALAATTG